MKKLTKPSGGEDGQYIKGWEMRIIWYQIMVGAEWGVGVDAG